MNIQRACKNEVHIITPTCHQFTSQIEIDTVRIFIGWRDLLKFDFDGFYMKIGAEKCSIGYTSRYKGFKILSSKKVIRITERLSNYYVGHYNTLPYSEIYNAVEKLGNELELDLHSARLYRVDINFNTILDEPSSGYTHHLFTDMPRFKRLEQVDGVIFKNNDKALQYYNKSIQLEETKGIITDDWLRLEFRILKNVKKHTGMVYVKDLYKLENYYGLLDLFLNHYERIKKQRIYSGALQVVKPKNYINALLLIGIERKRGESQIWRDIEQMDAQGQFTNRKAKSRLRSKLNKITANSSQMILNPLVEELNIKFFNAIQAEKQKYANS